MDLEPLNIPAGEPLAKSQVTARHWYMYGAYGMNASIQLRDNAIAMQTFDPWDHEAQRTMIKQGCYQVVIVCAGPEAPLPEPYYFDFARDGQEATR